MARHDRRLALIFVDRDVSSQVTITRATHTGRYRVAKQPHACGRVCARPTSFARMGGDEFVI